VEDIEVKAALAKAAEGGPAAMEAIAPVLEAYRARIERMLRLRMDQRVAGRVGVSDVMQDALMEVARRLPAYLAERETLGNDSGPAAAGAADGGPKKRARMPFFLWVRFLAGQALQNVHRQHLGTVARDAGRDVPLYSGGAPEASSLVLANALVESGLSPSGIVIQEEEREILDEALSSLRSEDREVLFMRHFEQLSNKEIAAILGLTPGGASLRHLKALARLQEALARFGISFDPSLASLRPGDKAGP
jgi:RNA polymerase sigma-70 factor (ECF subfamily)